MNWKEVFKFASGVCVWESVVHTSLWISGVLPLTMFGITISPTLNAVQSVLPAGVAVVLIYYAWFRK